MKNLKLKSLILCPVVATAAMVPCFTSCNKSTVKVNGASIDMSRSHIEVDRDSTIYLVPNGDSKITGIKNITVGTTTLSRMAYNFEYEQTNGLSYKLTIYAKSMTSVDISIDVFNSEMEIQSVSYTGQTLITNAVLNPYTLEVKAKYKDETLDRALTPGEYKVYDATSGTRKDITEQFRSANGYALKEHQQYTIFVESLVDSSKTGKRVVPITDPEKISGFFEAVDYPTVKDDECMLRLAKFELGGHTEISEIPKHMLVGMTQKNITSITANGYNGQSLEPSIIKEIKFEHGSLVKSIETDAFLYCVNIATVRIPSSLETIALGAFTPCSALAKVYIDSQAIVNLTDNDSGLFNADTVYVKQGLNVPQTSYISMNYDEGVLVDNYITWTKK